MTHTVDPFTRDELDAYRAEIAVADALRTDWTEPAWVVRRLLATIDLYEDAARALGRSLNDVLAQDGTHRILAEGYCTECQGGCIVEMARENTEAIYRAAFAGPSPFVVKEPSR